MTSEVRSHAHDRCSRLIDRWRSRSAAALALASAVIAVLIVSTAAPVAAHTGLESSQPSDGQVVDEPVERISLTFNRPVEPAGDGFTVSEGQGPHFLPDSQSSADGQTWWLDFDAPLGIGVYEVSWRVAAEDGHIVEGTFGFTVNVPGAESSIDSAPDAAAESAEGTAALDKVAEESLAGTSPAGSTDDGSTTLTTTPQAGEETPTVATAAPSPTTAPGGTAPAESEAASEDGPPRQVRHSSGAIGAERLAEALRIVGLLATLAIVGGLAFAAFIVRGEPSERARVHRVLFISGIVLVAGSVATALTQAAVIEDDWGAVVSPDAIADALSAPFGIAVGSRVLGGLVVLALTRPHAPRAASAGRFRFGTLGMIGAALVIVSYSFDGHTVTEGPRLLHAAANATHVTAAAVWSGGLVLLADLLRRRRRDAGLVGPLMRFSQLASVSLVLAGVAGTVMALLVMDRFADLWSTGWGRLLIAKVALVALAAVIGGRNRWVHMPAAAQHVSLQAQPLVQQRLFRAVSIEAAVLVAAGVVTAFLVGASAL